MIVLKIIWITNNAAVAGEMVPTPDIQGGSSDVFGNPSTDSVSSWNANEIIIIASIIISVIHMQVK